MSPFTCEQVFARAFCTFHGAFMSILSGLIGHNIHGNAEPVLSLTDGPHVKLMEMLIQG